MKYPSIKHAKCNTGVRVCPPDVRWVVCEKIHGANMSFYVTHDIVEPSSRNQVVDDPDVFFNSGSVVSRITPKLRAMYDELKRPFRVYGELFGGHYPGVDSERRKPVQREVLYSPRLEFTAFDVYLDDQWLSIDVARDILRRHHISIPRILFSGLWNEAWEWSCRHYAHPSIIPSPDLPPVRANIREGHILRPVTEMSTRAGRVIFKHKNPKFQERRGGTSDLRLEKTIKAALRVRPMTCAEVTSYVIRQGVVANKGRVGLFLRVKSGIAKTSGARYELTESIPEDVEQALEYITPGRVMSVKGHQDYRHYKQLARDVVDDALKDMETPIARKRYKPVRRAMMEAAEKLAQASL